MNITMYGIPNCNSIKKARDWLEANGIDYNFHNYKKSGIDEATLQQWCSHIGWKLLLNQRGTTWRKLSAEDKSGINEAKAIRLMAVYPSMIKRPVLQDMEHPARILAGFEEEQYQSFFNPAAKA